MENLLIPLSDDELRETNGGLFGWFVVGLAVLAAFAIGNAIGNETKSDGHCDECPRLRSPSEQLM